MAAPSKSKLDEYVKKNPKVLEAWIKAAGKASNLSEELLFKIKLIGYFCEVIAKQKASNALSGIDISKPVIWHDSLPKGVYVHYKEGAKGPWYTQTGMSPGDVGIAPGKRARGLYQPSGGVAALESYSKSIKDTWTPNRIFDPVDKRVLKLWIEKYRKKKDFQKLSEKEQEKAILEEIDKITKKLGRMCKGGGRQFFVAKPSAMKDIPTRMP